MTGASLAPACSPPSRGRNQKPPITARISTAATRPVVRDFDFRGGGSFSFDLFLDFLLIETIPGESSFKSEPYSASNHSRHPQRLKRRAPDGVPFVEYILHGDEGLDVADERARDRHVEHREAAQRQTVLVVVELFARGAELHRGGDVSRIRVDGLERELMAGDLRNPQTFERHVLRRAPNGGGGEMAARRD